MRVTNQMMTASMLYNVNQLRSRQASLTDQITSGDRITKVSEEPTAGGDVMRVQSRKLVMKQWESNLTNSKSWVNATEAKLGDITDIMNAAKELALAASTGTVSDETRKSLAPAAEQLLTNLMAALNEKEPNGYLFGGFQTETLEAFSLDSVTGMVTYNGDSGIMQRDVGPNVTLDVNIPGGRLVDTGSPDNLVKMLWDLKTALKTPALGTNTDTNADGQVDLDANGDLYIDEDVDLDSVIDTPTSASKLMPQSDASLVNRIAALIPKLDTGRQQVIALRSEMGARQMRIEAVETRLIDTGLQLESLLEQAQGVDMAKALLELNSAETTYRAALQVGARVLPPTLADFLR